MTLVMVGDREMISDPQRAVDRGDPEPGTEDKNRTGHRSPARHAASGPVNVRLLAFLTSRVTGDRP